MVTAVRNAGFAYAAPIVAAPPRTLASDEALGAAPSSFEPGRACGTPGRLMCFEDFIVEIFAIILERASEEIRELGEEITAFMEQMGTDGDVDPVEQQTLTDMQLELRMKLDDRKALFTMVLEIVEALTESAKRALESLGK